MPEPSAILLKFFLSMISLTLDPNAPIHASESADVANDSSPYAGYSFMDESLLEKASADGLNDLNGGSSRVGNCQNSDPDLILFYSEGCPFSRNLVSFLDSQNPAPDLCILKFKLDISTRGPLASYGSNQTSVPQLYDNHFKSSSGYKFLGDSSSITGLGNEGFNKLLKSRPKVESKPAG